MKPIPYYFLVLALTCSSVVSVFTTPGTQRRSSNGPKVLSPVTKLNIVNKVIAPDGFPRSTVLAEGTFPGPLIAARKGDNFRINVVNWLNDTSMDTATSVHWHGIYQRQSSWADGASGVSQCPIKPYKSFLYYFNAFDQTGTYWYHAHLSTQYCDGLRGPLVIYDPDDPHKHLYDVDDANTVITLSDWFHEPSSKLTKGPFSPDATLINGLGRYGGGPMSPLAVVNVEQGKRYRFRIVGASCVPWFNFTIDGHPMTVIETDGIETEPLVVDSLAVFPAQRYSVVITANQTVGNYWIRALSNHPNQTFDGGQSSAILRYAGALEQEPTTEHGPYVLPYEEGNVHPLISPGAPGIPEPGRADININMVPGLSQGKFTINGVSYSNPPLPVLLQILSGARHSSQLLPNGSVYALPPGKVIEVSIPATELSPGGALGGPHPIHLHGHTFDVIRTPGRSTYNFANPVRRDTIPIGLQANQDNVTFRFTTDNPGPWMIHCHIDFHLRRYVQVVTDCVCC
ncbi:laccase [Boletus edulis BED1]|uniref:Laccase n=1 Tax=Boletus edulis BED1 TaxID=1328754 RepID=A0AAD4C457_BOLED|nr:laccase [Boletus edulis BED1]